MPKPRTFISIMGSSPSSEKGFDSNTTAQQVVDKLKSNAVGKYIIVTGGSGGLGLETARVLAKGGAHVTVTCRTEEQGKKVVEKIKAEAPTAEIHAGVCDLSDLMSVKAFATDYTASKKPLHCLINNAGVMACEKSNTKQGFETQFGVCHLGHFYLTQKLMPVLESTGKQGAKSRVINVSSLGNWLYGPASACLWDDLQGEKHYEKWTRYGQAKLSNILHANELQRRFTAEGKNVMAAALHPGVIMATDLGRHNSLMAMVGNQFSVLGHSPPRLYAIFTQKDKTPGQGAATQTYLALCDGEIGNKWYCDCQPANFYLHEKANDEVTMNKLWTVSEELIKPYL